MDFLKVNLWASKPFFCLLKIKEFNWDKMVNNLDNQVLASSHLSKLMKKLEDIILVLKMEADNGKL